MAVHNKEYVAELIGTLQGFADASKELVEEAEENEKLTDTVDVLWIEEVGKAFQEAVDTLEYLRKKRKDDEELIKSLRHRFRSGIPYGEDYSCATPCGTDFCKYTGCRFTDG